jgi:hypothetical protein
MPSRPPWGTVRRMKANNMRLVVVGVALIFAACSGKEISGGTDGGGGSAGSGGGTSGAGSSGIAGSAGTAGASGSSNTSCDASATCTLCNNKWGCPGGKVFAPECQPGVVSESPCSTSELSASCFTCLSNGTLTNLVCHEKFTLPNPMGKPTWLPATILPPQHCSP